MADSEKFERKQEFYKRLLLINNFNISYMNLFRRSYSCKVSKYNQIVISYNGDVYKCSGRDFTDAMAEGKLQADGSVEWEEDKFKKRLAIKTYDNDMCRDCKLLPLCWGPCCQKQLETIPNDFQRFCQLNLMEMSLDDYVIYRFNNEMIYQRNNEYANM